MQSRIQVLRNTIVTGLTFALASATYVPAAHANVYASNIKINGVLNGSATVAPGTGGTITYILNESASSGVTIRILAGGTVVRTMSITGGSPGTTQGLNTVVWNGKNDSSANVPTGNYAVTISASSNGYLDWTQIITNASSKLYWASAIAVDTGTNSPYYGRVMVGNGVNTAQNVAPHSVAILKFNADGSEADEGQSNAGIAFRTDIYLGDSIYALKYGSDDRIYFNDWVDRGKVTACDMIMSTNQVILDSVSFFGPASLGNFPNLDVTNPGTTNALGWLSDYTYPGIGVWCWPLTNSGAADPGFAGINVVVAGGADIPLRSAFGLMIDNAGDIFVGEVRSNLGDAFPKLTCIRNWQSASALPITNGNLGWQAGALVDDTFLNLADISIDSRAKPKYVSAVFENGAGGLKILSATDGSVVKNINQSVGLYYISTCWDNAGNLYAGSDSSTWVVFSPPGANQATTPALVRVQVTAQPVITSIGVSGGMATIHFTSGATNPLSAFSLLSAGVIDGIYSPAAGSTITGGDGTYLATVATSGEVRFYRIQQ